MRSFTITLSALAVLGSTFGCAAVPPPKDLVNARVAYERASNGPAQTLDPKDLDAARKLLATAEASFEEDGDTQVTRDHAYLALRKAEYAEVIARTKGTAQAQAGVTGEMHDDQKEALAATSAALGRSKEQIEDEQRAGAMTSAELGRSQAELASEKALREAAEKRAAEAAAALAAFAKVKQEPRGMVITLSGGVLFASAKWDLLPQARAKLDEVAKALAKGEAGSTIVVEGHTDSRGGDAYNQDLSQKRAEAVRTYLVSRGVAADRITAQGFGSGRSIADNASAEGRANNRRVEIVVSPPKR